MSTDRDCDHDRARETKAVSVREIIRQADATKESERLRWLIKEYFDSMRAMDASLLNDCDGVVQRDIVDRWNRASSALRAEVGR